METEKYIEQKVKGQKWKYLFVLAAWPFYLVIIPGIFNAIGFWSVIFIIFPGLYLFTWTAYLMHESWHSYVPGLPSKQLYYVYGWMILSDPQLYHAIHGFHHSKVNSWEDTEFHPPGKIENVLLRKAYNLGEILAGGFFVMIFWLIKVPFHPLYAAKYHISRTLASVVIWSAFLSTAGFLSEAIFGARASGVVTTYAIMFYFGSLLVHHSQLVEHGNLIAEGDLNERNLKTRNLDWNAGILEKLFLILTHGDSRAHILHHTNVRVYSRPFPGLFPVPQGAVMISLKDYLGILKGMLQ